MNLKEIFGKNVKYYRFKNHLTQENLADILNVSPNYISRLDLGKHNPSLNMIDKLSKALNIEPSELFIKLIKLLYLLGLIC
ncbi:MAG: helix-turn-helix transcriptional regulator [Bacilli bacterium]|nr:helix-turn-helix transcriptional regulator [Bacilli bacterium]